MRPATAAGIAVPPPVAPSANANAVQQAEDLVTKHDYGAALELLRPLADQGNSQAQLDLGWIYENGRGVAQDDAQAVVWIRKAADQGDAEAQYILGRRYENGRGVAQDDAQAAAWYRKASDQGNATAQRNLAAMYANGRGVPSN
jgi:TPR repeat protein